MIIASMMLVLAVSQGVASDTLESDRSGKGAVLCAWRILESVRAVGQECFKDRDAALQDALDKSLSRIDRFILDNSSRHISMKGLDARRVEGLRQLHEQGNICTGGAAKMYLVMQARGPDSLRRMTDDLLSVPREPVLNPCI
jgi:hypothetical protein